MDEPRLVSSTDPTSQPALRDLDRRMSDYYNRPEMGDYFDTAHSFNAVWSEQSGHAVIRKAARPGLSVLDLGCGSGHSWVNLKDAGVRYTGVDVSAQQVERNRKAYGQDPTFIAGSLYESGLPDSAFDLTFSTYVLEHLVWPQRFLSEMTRVTRPGGLMIVLCPHFRPEGRIPSLRYGRTVATLKQRVARGHLIAAARHYYLRNVHYPRMLRRRYPRQEYPFLINLEPTCLTGPYYPDNDAVYFTDRDELVTTFEQLGATDVSRSAGDGNAAVWLPGTCFLAVRKG
jgi:ubiquinone/menaquinone biosynthesis C-methylase UbiE